jgi:cytochrome P450
MPSWPFKLVCVHNMPCFIPQCSFSTGSDSTASVLTFIIFFLTSNPLALKRLRAELEDPKLQADMWLHPPRLAELPYLNAVIWESLRLGTPFPGLPRVIPQPGVMLEGKFFPAGTVVSVPAYVQQTRATNFSPEPEKWIPERWLGEDSKFQTNKNAMMCFSYGGYSPFPSYRSSNKTLSLPM